MTLSAPNEYGAIIGEPVASREWKHPTARGAARLTVYQTAVGFYWGFDGRSPQGGVGDGPHECDPVHLTQEAAMDAAIERARAWFVVEGASPWDRGQMQEVAASALKWLDSLHHEPLELGL